MVGKPTGNPNGRPPFWTREKLIKEGEAMIEWAQKEDSYVLADFYASRGYDYDDVHDFEKRCPEFAKAKRISKMLVGAKREKGALLGKLDSGIVRKSMALYDPEMKAYEIELKNASKSEIKEVIEDGFLIAIRETNAARELEEQSRISGHFQSNMASQ